MKKSNLLLCTILLSCIFFNSCQKEVATEEINYEEIDQYLLELQTLTTKIADKAKGENSTFQSNAVELENLLQNEKLGDATAFIETTFGVTEAELGELSGIGNAAFINSKKTKKEFESIIEKRVEKLVNDGIIFFDFDYEMTDELQASSRVPCWWVALYGVITSATALAGGCATGVGCIAGGVYAVATIVNTTATLCGGGCSGGGGCAA